MNASGALKPKDKARSYRWKDLEGEVHATKEMLFPEMIDEDS
jgi:hypothetical protein